MKRIILLLLMTFFGISTYSQSITLDPSAPWGVEQKQSYPYTKLRTTTAVGNAGFTIANNSNVVIGGLWYSNANDAININGTSTHTTAGLIFKRSNSKVGIGTFNPEGKLEIYHNSLVTDPTLNLIESSTTDGARLTFGNSNPSYFTLFGNPSSTAANGIFNLYHSSVGNIMTWKGDGNVGVGVTSPSQKLNIRDGNILLETGTVDKVYIQANGANSAGEMTLYASNGNQTIEIRGSDALNKAGEILMYDPTTNLKTLEIDGDWQSTGKSRIIVDELQITGGADFAEYFNMEGEIVPEVGTILSVSSNGSADLEISNKPYDSKVVGVLSGANGVNPGIMLKQKDSKITNGDYPVAISGRVYVKAEATKNEIKPGDLLTSSDKAGFAMKATKKKKYAGAIIGKALTGLESEEGFVLVLLGAK